MFEQEAAEVAERVSGQTAIGLRNWQEFPVRVCLVSLA